MRPVPEQRFAFTYAFYYGLSGLGCVLSAEGAPYNNVGATPHMNTKIYTAPKGRKTGILIARIANWVTRRFLLPAMKILVVRRLRA